MEKEICYASDIREKLQSGINLLADTMKTAFGPNGRNVLLQTSEGHLLETTDGGTIAKNIILGDPVENISVEIMKSVAAKTKDKAGGGTITQVILVRSILQEAMKNIAAGADPIQLKKGIQIAAAAADKELQKLARPVSTETDLVQVAAIAAADNSIGKIIAKAMKKVGPNGAVKVEAHSGMETILKVEQGMQFDRGVLSTQFYTDANLQTTELADPLILVTDQAITNLNLMIPILEKVMAANRSLLIIAEELSESVLSTLVMNKLEGILQVAAVHPPAYGDGRQAIMEDIALLTGAVFLTEETGHPLKDAVLSDLGSARSVRIEKKQTLIMEVRGNATAIDRRVENLKQQITVTDYDFNRNRMKERLARLSGGVATIQVGGPTELEMNEKKLRIDSAVTAAKSAVKHGIIAGGGVALLDIVPALEPCVSDLSNDLRTGGKIILQALEAPVRQLAQNAGFDGSLVCGKIKELPTNTGLDVLASNYTDMFESGIVDPASSLRLALLGAASVAATLLTTEASLTGKK